MRSQLKKQWYCLWPSAKKRTTSLQLSLANAIQKLLVQLLRIWQQSLPSQERWTQNKQKDLTPLRWQPWNALVSLYQPALSRSLPLMAMAPMCTTSYMVPAPKEPQLFWQRKWSDLVTLISNEIQQNANILPIWLLFSWWKCKQKLQILLQHWRDLRKDFEDWQGHLTRPHSRHLYWKASTQQPTGWWKWWSTTPLWKVWCSSRKRKIHSGSIWAHHSDWHHPLLQEPGLRTLRVPWITSLKLKCLLTILLPQGWYLSIPITPELLGEDAILRACCPVASFSIWYCTRAPHIHLTSWSYCQFFAPLYFPLLVPTLLQETDTVWNTVEVLVQCFHFYGSSRMWMCVFQKTLHCIRSGVHLPILFDFSHASVCHDHYPTSSIIARFDTLLCLWFEVLEFALTCCTELIALNFAPVRFTTRFLPLFSLFFFSSFPPFPVYSSPLLPLSFPFPPSSLPSFPFLSLLSVPFPLLLRCSFPCPLVLCLPFLPSLLGPFPCSSSPLPLLSFSLPLPPFPLFLFLPLPLSPYCSPRSFWEVSRKLNLYLIIVKLWIDPVLLTEMLHLWLVPGPWSIFLFGVAQTRQILLPVVLGSHQTKVLHNNGIKVLVAYNLPRDCLWHRTLNRSLLDKLVNLKTLWACHNKVALFHKIEDITQAMEYLLLLDLMYMALDLGVWHHLFPPLHLLGLHTSFLDKFLAIFDHRHLDQELLLFLLRDLLRLHHQVDRTQERPTLLEEHQWAESQTYLWANIGNLMKSTMTPRSLMDWFYLELSGPPVGVNWKTLKVVILLQYLWASASTREVRISGYENWLQEEKYMWQQWGKSAKWSLWVKYYHNSAPAELTLTNWHSIKLSKMAMHWRKGKPAKAWQNRLETNFKDGPHQSKQTPAPNTKLLNLKQDWQHSKRPQTNPKLLLLAIIKQKLQHQHLKANLLHLEYNLLLQQLSKDKDLQPLTLPNCSHGWRAIWSNPSVIPSTKRGSRTWNWTMLPDRPWKGTLRLWTIGGRTNQKMQKLPSTV